MHVHICACGVLVPLVASDIYVYTVQLPTAATHMLYQQLSEDHVSICCLMSQRDAQLPSHFPSSAHICCDRCRKCPSSSCEDLNRPTTDNAISCRPKLLLHVRASACQWRKVWHTVLYVWPACIEAQFLQKPGGSCCASVARRSAI